MVSQGVGILALRSFFIGGAGKRVFDFSSTVALHSLYLRTVRSRTLQVRPFILNHSLLSVTDPVNVATFTHCIACLFTAVTYNKI